MNQVPRQKLMELLARDRTVVENAQLCEAMLRDLCRNEYKREVKALADAVREGVARELTYNSRSVPVTALLSRLSQKLHDDCGLREDISRWAVESWAIALRVIQESSLTSTPKSPQVVTDMETMDERTLIDEAKERLRRQRQAEEEKRRQEAIRQAAEEKALEEKRQQEAIRQAAEEKARLELDQEEEDVRRQARFAALAERKRLGEIQEIVLPGGVNLELLRCPAGTFTMGSPASETGRFDNETQHQVTLTKPFWMGKTQVTQAQWQALMGANSSFFNGKGSDLPVEHVSWDEAVAFCKMLTECMQIAGKLPSGYEYRLPTEAEWEYACRAGTTGAYAGDLDRMGWYEKNSAGKSHAVAGKDPNAWGLYDMHGNVFEWCQDWYGSYPAGEVTDPIGPITGAPRVSRGGSWGYHAGFCRAAFRRRFEPGFRYFNLGFRVALAPAVR